MLLGASGQRENKNYDLAAITGQSGDAGVAGGDVLRALTEAAIGSDWLTLAQIRPAAEAAIGAQAVVDALVVAAAFNGITRVADCTGIPLDVNTETTTKQMRIDTGIADFDYGAKSDRYG